jgi:predicted nucleic acid-binding protein
MIIYALDTNIISYYLKNNQQIINRISLELTNNNKIVVPPIVYFEIKRWLLSNNSKTKLLAFETLCKHSDLGIIDKEILEIAIFSYIILRKKGLVIEDADILIAAYCIKNNYTLVTNNIKHLKNIENLAIINWID